MCWTGPADAQGKGICEDGQQACSLIDGVPAWGDCDGEVLPGTEIPGNDIDENCDGSDLSCADLGNCPCEDTPWGEVPHGFTDTAYAVAHPETGDGTCDDMSQTRTCNNGLMTGSFTQTECSNYACVLTDPELGDGFFQVGVWYLETVVPNSNWRMCQADGTWGPSQAPPTPNPGAQYCGWAGLFVPNYACGFYMGDDFMCDAPDWIESGAGGCPDDP